MTNDSRKMKHYGGDVLNWEIILRLVILLLGIARHRRTNGKLGRPCTGDGSYFLGLRLYRVPPGDKSHVDPYMPIVVNGAILGGVVLAAISPGIHSAPGVLAVAGAICYAAVIAITRSTNLRINNLIARWSIEALPENWTTVRARWIRFHILRTLISVSALASYVLSVLTQQGMNYASTQSSQAA